MAPDNKPEEKRQQYPRVPNKKEGGGVWDTVFQYCMAICRTHVFSTSHENAYIGARHHCFSKLGKPLVRVAVGFLKRGGGSWLQVP